MYCAAQPLAQRMRRDERLQLGDVGAAEAQPRLDVVLDHAQMAFGEAGDVPAGEAGVGHVGERGAAPEPQRGGEVVRGPRGVLGQQRLPAGGEPVELDDVDGVAGAGDQPVAGRM